MLFIEKCLPLADHSEYMVIDNHFNQRKLLSGCCCKFIHIHAETSVSRNIDHLLIRICSLCTNCSAKTIPHRTKTSGCQQGSWFTVFKILCSPHLMLTDFRDHNGIFCHLIDLCDHKRTT